MLSPLPLPKHFAHAGAVKLRRAPLLREGEPVGADKGTSVRYKKSAAWGKFHPL